MKASRIRYNKFALILEIVEELTCWSKNHSAEELDAAMNNAIAERSDSKNAAKYHATWQEIYAEIVSALN